MKSTLAVISLGLQQPFSPTQMLVSTSNFQLPAAPLCAVQAVLAASLISAHVQAATRNFQPSAALLGTIQVASATSFTSAQAQATTSNQTNHAQTPQLGQENLGSCNCSAINR